MNDKSYVSMEQHVCIVCGKAFETNTILLDRRMRESLERYTITGRGVCNDDQKKFNDGFVAIVELDVGKTKVTENRVKPGDEYRTGKIAYVKRSAFEQIMNVAVDDSFPVCYCGSDVMAILESIEASIT